METREEEEEAEEPLEQVLLWTRRWRQP